MSLLFHFTEQLVIRYPEKGQGLIDELPGMLEENLETYSFQVEEIVFDGIELYIECGFTLNVLDPVLGEILQFLDETLKEWGIEDIAVYFEPGFFYGIAVDYEYWDGTLSEEQQKAYVQFELVDKELIEPFINPEISLSVECRTPETMQVFDVFRKEGVHGENFMRMKSGFLGGHGSGWIFMALDETELENINISNWYELKIYRIGLEENMVYYMDDFDWRYGYRIPVPEPEFACFYKVADESVQDALQELYEIASSPDSAGSGQFQNGIRANTEFGKIEIFNVGQALCVGIYELFGYTEKKQNRLAAFFDFGIPYTAGRPRPNMAPDYQAICNEIADFANGYGRGKETRDHIHIILSHWHLDHCILALTMTTELAHTIWHVPCEGLGPAAQKICSHIVQYGGKINAVVGPATALCLEGNQNLQFGKIDFGSKRHPNPRIVSASRHPHHHGMYLIAELKDGRRVFLSGDCTYAGIDSELKKIGFQYLQASHHGGNYALRPAVRNAGDIPKPGGQAVGVIYSSGPYSKHHHPDQASINEHQAAGWPAYHITYNNGKCTIQ